MGSKIAITVGCLVVYFGLMAWAAFFSKTGKMENKGSIDEYAVGDRNFGWVIVLFTLMGLFVTASIYASWFSWAVFEGIFVQYLCVYSVFGFVFTYLFAKRIWVWGKEYNFLTQPDYIQKRYNSRPLSCLFGVAAVLIEAPWIIIEFAAMGALVQALTYGAIPYRLGMIIIVVFVMAYIMYSGMKSLAITELLQGALSTVVIMGGFIFIIYKLFGGFGPMYEQVYAVAPDNLTISFGGTYSYSYWSSVIITASLGVMGWASFFTRIYTSKSIMDVKKVSWWSALIAVVVCTLLFVVALGGILVPEAVTGAETDTGIFAMAELAGGPWFLGLMGVVVVAAGMSLISVVMNSHSIIISENFIKPFKPNITSVGRVKIARWTTLIYSLIALGIALCDIPNLYDIAIVAYECIAQVVPMVVLSMYWKRSNKYGAGLGFVVGAVVTVAMTVSGATVLGFTGGVVGLVVNVLIHVICGFVCPKDKGVDEMFEVIERYEN
ncbi:MAG: sodium:solute symporter family protein [Bacillota bacterium]|jgi:SSS family solute:Na+ symporter